MQRIIHVRDEFRKHLVRRRSFPLKILEDAMLAFRGNNLDPNGARLSKPPASAYFLVILLVGMGWEERHSSAMLPVEAESTDPRLRDEHANLARRKGEKNLFLAFVGVRPTDLNGTTDDPLQKIALFIQMTPSNGAVNGGQPLRYLLRSEEHTSE